MCEYCQGWDAIELINTMNTISYKTEKYPGIRIEIDVDGTMNIYSVADTYEPSFMEETLKINFCPMCGRDLREESED